MKSSISLRALEPEDLDLVYRIENDQQLWLSSGMSHPLSHHAVRQYLTMQKADIYQDGQLRLVIERGGERMGIIDFTDFCPHHLRAEVGIVVLPEFQRQGIGSEALMQMENYASLHLHLACIYAYVQSENVAARQLFLRLGYQEMCILPRWVVGHLSAILYQKILE